MIRMLPERLKKNGDKNFSIYVFMFIHGQREMAFNIPSVGKDSNLNKLVRNWLQIEYC